VKKKRICLRCKLTTKNWERTKKKKDRKADCIMRAGSGCRIETSRKEKESDLARDQELLMGRMKSRKMARVGTCIA
jgi:hypothetical protein